MLTIDALDAMCPPTFTANSASRPSGAGGSGRSRLAWSTIRTASQSTRRWISSRVARSGAASGMGRWYDRSPMLNRCR